MNQATYDAAEVDGARLGLPKMFLWTWAWAEDDTGLRICITVDKSDVLMRCCP